MKKMRKIFTLLVGILLLSSVSFSQNAGYSIPTDLKALPGTDIVVPVTMFGVDTLGSFGMQVTWNSTVLTYKSSDFPKLTGSFLSNVIGNSLIVSWFSNPTTYVRFTTTGEIIGNITFTYNGPGCSDVAFDNSEDRNLATNNPLGAAEPITYNLTLASGKVCQEITQINITTQPQSIAVCEGAAASFSLAADGQTGYLWQVSTDGGTIWNDVSSNVGLDLPNVTLAMNGNQYRCILSNSDGNKTSDVAVLTVNALPVVSINKVGNDLSVTAGFAGYQWYYNGGQIIGATLNTYTATQNGAYYVHVTSAANCTYDSPSKEVIIAQALAITDVTATQLTVCKGSSTKLDVTITGGTGNISYLWTPGDGTESSFTVTPDSPTTYTIKVTDDLTSVEQTIDIDVNPIPVATITPESDLTFCQGDNVILDATTGVGYTYQWKQNGTSIDGATNETYMALVGASYTVEVSALNCTALSTETVVTVNPLPTVEITPSGDQFILEGQTIELTANTTATITDWKKDGVSLGVNTSIYTADTTGLYTVVVNNELCNNESAGVQVTLVTIPPLVVEVNANPDPICAGQTSTISAVVTGGSDVYTYVWSNDQTESTFDVTPAGTTLYSVTVTDVLTSVTGVGSATLTVNPIPTAEITPANPLPVIAPETVTLTATTGTGYTYVWYKDGVLVDGATNETFVVSEVGTFSYFVIITAENCSSLPSIPVSVTINPVGFDFTISMSAKNNPICKGETVTLQAQVFPTQGLNYTWIWSNGKEVMNFNDTPTETTTYFVTITETTNNLTKVAQVTVTVDTPPVADITPAGPKTIVEGQQVTLQATTGTGYTYVWLKNAIVIQNETNDNLVVTSAGIYQVIIHSGVCSANSNLVTINTVPPVQVDVTASLNPICVGTGTAINAVVTGGSGDFGYMWSNDATTSGFDATPAGTTLYSVTVTDNVTLETATGSVTVTVNALPIAVVTPEGATTFCAGNEVDLDANFGDGYSYQWMINGDNIDNATNQSYLASVSGNFSVMITSLNCNATSNEIAVTVNALPTATLNYTGTQTVFIPNTITLIANDGSGYTFKWFNNGIEINGETTNTYTPTEDGVYTVEVTANTCNATSLAVTVHYVVPGVCDLNVPTNLHAVAGTPTQTKVTLAWDKVNIAQDSAFIVRIHPTLPAGNNNYIYKVITNGGTSVTKYSLTPCTDYETQVRARCTSRPDGLLHKSAYSPVVAFKTKCDDEVCPPATNLQHANITTNSADVSWTIPATNGNATSYTVRYIGDQPGAIYHFRKTNTPSLKLLWLENGTNYTWDVKVFCAGLNTKRLYVAQDNFRTLGTYVPKMTTEVAKTADFYVYPNPSNGLFTVSVSGMDNTSTMTVLNLQGQVVYSKDYSNSFTEDVDLSGLAKGVYFIKLMNENSNQVRKIVIQ